VALVRARTISMLTIINLTLSHHCMWNWIRQ